MLYPLSYWSLRTGIVAASRARITLESARQPAIKGLAARRYLR